MTLPTGSSASLTPLRLLLACLLPLAVAAWAWLVAGPALGAGQAALLLALVTVPAAGLWLAAHAGQSAGLPLAVIAAAIVMLSDATLRERAEGRIDAQSLLKLGIWMLALLLALWRGRQLWRALHHAPSGWLAALGAWCLLSTLWSATPAYTAAAAIAWLGMWTAATTLADAMPLRRGLLTILTALTLTMLLSLAMLALAPALALTPMDNGAVMRLSGLFASPNNLGRAAALTVLLALLAWPRMKGRAALAVALIALLSGAACLHLSASRGSLAALLLALAFVVARHRLWLPLVLAWLLAWSLALAALAVLMVPDLGSALVGLFARSGRAEELLTFTGRTEIWQAAWGLIGQAPWLGHGFGSTREVLPAAFQGAFGWTTTSAHNLWLQAWVTLGGVGLLLVLAAQGAWAVEALRRSHPVRDAVLALVLLIGVLEASALGPSVNLMSFVWMWAAALGLRERQA